MSIRTIAILALLMVAAMGAGWMPGAQLTAPAQQPLRVATRLVQVDVIVLDKHGNPVTGLTKDDFVVLDNKSPRTIQVFSTETAQVLSAVPPLPAGTYSNEIQAAGVPSNLTVILLDSFNTGSLDQAYVRSQVAKLLRTLRAEDRVALYTLGAHLQVLQEFTSDSGTLDASLKKYLGERAVDMDLAKSHSMGVFNTNLQALSDDA